MTALIFYNITRCYDKHVAVFAVAVATGDIIKYQSFVYGSFVWEIHARYNKIKYMHCSEKVQNNFVIGKYYCKYRIYPVSGGSAAGASC